MSEMIKTIKMLSKDVNPNKIMKDERFVELLQLMGTEGVATLQTRGELGGVQKRLDQVDRDRPDVCGIPLTNYARKHDVAIKKKENGRRGCFSLPLTDGVTMNPPAHWLYSRQCSFSTSGVILQM